MDDDPAQEGSRTIVAAAAAGQRLDRFLMARLPDQSRSALQRLIEAGEVRVNGAASKPGYHLRPGDNVGWRLPPPSLPTLEPEPIPLDVVFEDADLLVINKPKGMVVHPAPGNWTGTLVNALLARGSFLDVRCSDGEGSSREKTATTRGGLSRTAPDLGAEAMTAHPNTEQPIPNPEMFRPGI